MSLRLREGPIDLVIRAWGGEAACAVAYAAARGMFSGILPGLMVDWGVIRGGGGVPGGAVARAMCGAVAPYAGVTPMAAVAGAVADAVLGAMVGAAELDRAFVNNGGDIAFHLAAGTVLRCAVVSDLASPLHDGTLVLEAGAPSRGVATSGRACKGRGGAEFLDGDCG